MYANTCFLRKDNFFRDIYKRIYNDLFRGVIFPSLAFKKLSLKILIRADFRPKRVVGFVQNGPAQRPIRILRADTQYGVELQKIKLLGQSNFRRALANIEMTPPDLFSFPLSVRSVGTGESFLRSFDFKNGS